MTVHTRHTLEELLCRSKLALKNFDLIEIVIAHQLPSGAQKTTVMQEYSNPECYATWALAAIKRDYPDKFEELPEIVKFREFAQFQKTPRKELENMS